jgi:3-hydroxyacyl-CoA dehydrogenase
MVPGHQTSKETLTLTAGLMERLGKRPVILKQFVPAFIVNRIQMAMGRAVMEILEQGGPPQRRSTSP